MNYRTLALLIFAVMSIFVSSCGGEGSSSPASASQSLSPPSGPVVDFAGIWNMLGVSTGDGGQGVLVGQMSVDAYGDILCGGLAVANETGSEIIGGRVYLDDNGVITGSFVTEDGTTRTVTFGRMEPSMMFAAFIASGPAGQELFALVRAGDGFAEADFVSAWNLFGLASIDAPEGSLHGELDIAGAGAVTGSYTHSNGNLTIIEAGSLNPAGMQNGRIEGALTAVPPPPVALDGFLSNHKDKGMIRATTDAGEQKYHKFLLFIKSGGSFNTVDLAGIWAFVSASAGGPDEGVCHGTLEVDGSGAVRAGSVIREGVSTAVTGGSVAIEGGIVSGAADLADGGTMIISSGKLDPAKTTMFSVGSTGAGSPSIMIWFKQS